MAIAEAPPRKATPAQASAARKTAAAHAAREDALNGLGQIAQMGLIGARQLADASAVGMHWPGIAREVANLADADAMIARIVDPLIRIGPYTALVGACLPLAAQILVNHKAIPAGTMGTVSGDMLESRMLLSIRQEELRVKKQQEEAEAELRRLMDTAPEPEPAPA